ncbi:MAG: hypothetical protein Q9225_005867 [Loekoesia sp. 1 TL-2023]
MAKRIIYQALNHDIDEIRLVTILPLTPGIAESTRIECILQKFRIDDSQYTLAYKKHLQSKDAPGAWTDPQASSDNLSKQSESDDWVRINSPNDDLTVNLPEFRYKWGDFMALSYTWGDPNDCTQILVNGHPLIVTKNVEAGLKQLRNKRYIQQGWKIWIDAICINQRDLKERASQVKRMCEIYTKAWTPLVWLGEQKADTDRALDLIEILASDYSSSDGVVRLTNALHKNPEFFGKGSWRALYEIIIRPYWRRLWILQEISRGRITTPVLCGPRTLSWYKFSCAFGVLVQSDEAINTYIVKELQAASIPFDIEVWASIDTVRAIPAFRDVELSSKHPNMYPLLLTISELIEVPVTRELIAAFILFHVEIWSSLAVVSDIQTLQDSQQARNRSNPYGMLQLSRTVFALDPRDKVYALLGLMDDSLVARIEPDYTAPLLDVYRSFALATVKETGSLDIIRHTAGPTPDSTMPTWVPDLRVAPHSAALTLGETSFNASGLSRASIQTFPDLGLLSCKGFIVDRFDGLGCLWAKRWNPDSVIQTQGDANPYGSFEAVREAIWISLVACHSLPNEKLDDADYSSLLAVPALAKARLPSGSVLKEIIRSNVFDFCLRALEGDADFRVAGRAIKEYFWARSRLEEGINPVDLRAGLMQRDRVNVRRRMATTERGYVGMVVETVEREDVIAVLQGCSMPMVLRRAKIPPEEDQDGDRWQVVGECYLHEIMDGEAMDWGLETQDIMLC